MSLPSFHCTVRTGAPGQTDMVGAHRSRSQARGPVGLSQHCFDSRRCHGQAQSGGLAAVLAHGPSGVTGHSKQAGTVRNQSAVRNLPWLVSRPCVELSCPVGL